MLMEENRKRIRWSNSFRIFIWRIIKISGGEEVQSMLIPVVVGWVPAGRILRPKRRCRKEVDQRIRSLQNRKAAVECHRLERCQGLWRHFQCSKDLLRPFAFGLLYAQIDGWHGTAVSDVFKKIIQLFSSLKKKYSNLFDTLWTHQAAMTQMKTTTKTPAQTTAPHLFIYSNLSIFNLFEKFKLSLLSKLT